MRFGLRQDFGVRALTSQRLAMMGLAVAALVTGLLVPSSAKASQTAGLAAETRAAGDQSGVVWLCRPGLRDNPCEIPLDTTVQRADGSERVVTDSRKPSRRRPVDCFYVYPTVSNQLTPAATKAKDPELYSIAQYQAARFSRTCRMYAPVYRQGTLASLVPFLLTGQVEPPPHNYTDVRQAWRKYLKHRNHGRGVILIGHSQGTLMLRKLLREEIDPNPRLRRQLVGAFLMGGNVTVKEGRTRGGDFLHVPLCTRKGQTGCVVAYSTYATEPPSGSATFGDTMTDALTAHIPAPSGEGYEVACTDPARLVGRRRAVPMTIPTEPFAPGLIRVGIQTTASLQVPTAETTWVSTADRYRGRCETIDGAHIYLEEPVADSRRLVAYPAATWGTHLVDINLGLDRLVRIARIQTEHWLNHRP